MCQLVQDNSGEIIALMCCSHCGDVGLLCEFHQCPHWPTKGDFILCCAASQNLIWDLTLLLETLSQHPLEHTHVLLANKLQSVSFYQFVLELFKVCLQAKPALVPEVMSSSYLCISLSGVFNHVWSCSVLGKLHLCLVSVSPSGLWGRIGLAGCKIMNVYSSSVISQALLKRVSIRMFGSWDSE